MEKRWKKKQNFDKSIALLDLTFSPLFLCVLKGFTRREKQMLWKTNYHSEDG